MTKSRTAKTRDKPVLEIVPWIHGSNFAVHGEVLNYIGSLPKNSVLFLETDPKSLAITNKFMESQNKIAGGALLALENNLPGIAWNGFTAYLEILHIAKKKNIEIVPLESLSSVGEGSVRKLFSRERDWLSVILGKIRRIRNRRTIILIGGGQTPYMKDLLNGYATVHIQTNIFSEREKIERLMQIEKEDRNAHLAGDMAKAKSASYELPAYF